MVAVIIVGMSFLLKAFGIDLIGWLMDKFKGLGVPDEGKILFVELDNEEFAFSNPEVWKFFLTDEETQFIQKVEPGGYLVNKDAPIYFLPQLTKDPDVTNKCLLYIVNEENRDLFKSFYYKVLPGKTLQAGCTSLSNCLMPEEVTRCVNGQVGEEEATYCPPTQFDPYEIEKCKYIIHNINPSTKNEPYVIANCGCGGVSGFCDSEKGAGVLGWNFDETITFDGECKAREGKINSKQCNLLDPPISGDRDQIKIKYGLLCADDGKWHTCKEQTGSHPIQAILHGKAIHCDPGEFFVWNEQEVRDAIAASQQPGIITNP